MTSEAEAAARVTRHRHPREGYDLAAPAASLPVTRELFDQIMVPCYAPAPFIPVRG